MMTLALFAHLFSPGMLALATFGMVAVGMACATNPGAPGSNELGSALDSFGGKCAAAPLPRDWQLVDRMDSSRIQPGTEVFVNWDSISPMDDLGRHAQIRAIKICGRVTLQANGANAAVTAYQLRSLIQNIFLSDIGRHAYYAAINGRSVIDDNWLRAWRLPSPLLGAVPANLPAGSYTFDVTLEFVLQGRFAGASGTEGLISLAAIQAVDGSQGMRFTPGLSIFGNPAPAGLAVVDYRRDDGPVGLDVWADIVYSDTPMVDAPWSVREYVIAQPNGALQRPREKTEYAAVRYFPEDAANNLGQQLAGGIDNVALEVAGKSFAPQRAIDFVRRQSSLEISAIDSASALGLPALGQPAEPGVTTPMLMICPQRTRESAPSGPVIFKFSTQPATFARYIHRTVACDVSERAARILGAQTETPCVVYQPGNNMPGITDPTAPKLLVPAQK